MAPCYNVFEPVKRYPNFDFLRLFLASEVMGMHVCGDLTHRGYAEVFPVLINTVAVFLAISGFMVLKSWQSVQSLKTFWARRMIRIMPALMCSFGLVLVVAGIPGLYRAFLTYITFGGFPYSPNGVLWSLSTEEVFYGALCLIAFAGGYGKPKLIGYAAVVATIGNTVAFAIFGDQGQRWMMLVAPFLVGNWMFVSGFRFKSPALAWSLVLQMAIRNSFVLLFHPPQLFDALTFPLSLSLACLGLLDVCQRADWPIVLRADISYGIYVYHAPLIFFAHNRNLAPLATWLLVAPGTVAISLCSHYLVEKPFSRLKHRRSTLDNRALRADDVAGRPAIDVVVGRIS